MKVKRIIILTLACATTMAAFQPAMAAKRKHGNARQLVQDDRYADFVTDPNTGQVLHAVNEDAPRYPASLTKMMTLYLTFDALRSGKLSMNDKIPVSRHAAAQAPSSIGVTAGDSILVRDAVLATIVKSANDAAVVLAEAVGGSEDHFAEMMTAKARALGMGQTTFRNASGLPDDRQKTTARDLAKLGIALFRDHAEYYGLFSRTSFEYRGQTIHGHNRLMARYRGADGIKTGFINKSGFNLVTSAERDGRRLVGVVMGGDTSASRDNRMAALLDQGFEIPATTGSSSQMMASAKAPSPAPAATDQVTFDIADIESAIHPVAADAPDDVDPQTKPRKTLKFPSLIGRAEAATGNGAGASRPASWVIQLGAFSKPALAEAILDRASNAAPHLLRGAETVIMQSKSGGKTYYRARMVGFDETEAQAACTSLKGKNFRCLVVSPAASAL